KTVQMLDRVLSVASRPGRCPHATCVGSRLRLLSAAGQGIAPAGSTYGYDVVVHIGWWRQEARAKYREIHAALASRVRISESHVGYLYQQVYLPLLACHERQHHDRLAQIAQQQGGLIVALDGLAPQGVAPQLTVVSAPPLNQALERMRRTPTSLGWRPLRRRHAIGQQFLHTPAMIGDASGHRRCGLAAGMGQTLVRCADVIDRPDQIPAMLQGQRAACERPASARQRRQTLTERGVQSLDVRRVDHAVSLRATPERLDAGGRAIHDAPLDIDDTPLGVALHDLGDQDMAPLTKSGPSTRTRVHG